MTLSAGAILASLVVSSVGLAFFVYGKKELRMPQLAGGLALMLFPYFVSSAVWMLAIGAAITVATLAAARLTA